MTPYELQMWCDRIEGALLIVAGGLQTHGPQQVRLDMPQAIAAVQGARSLRRKDDDPGQRDIPHIGGSLGERVKAAKAARASAPVDPEAAEVDPTNPLGIKWPIWIVTGTDRALGAQGAFENFIERVEAAGVDDAMANVREKRSPTRQDIFCRVVRIQDEPHGAALTRLLELVGEAATRLEQTDDGEDWTHAQLLRDAARPFGRL